VQLPFRLLSVRPLRQAVRSAAMAQAAQGNDAYGQRDLSAADEHASCRGDPAERYGARTAGQESAASAWWTASRFTTASPPAPEE